MDAPKISATVSILTRNSSATLERALLSVSAFAEILVADGGSTDTTLEIARAYGARIIEQDAVLKDPNGRLIDFSGARNACLAAATFDWHVYVDSDEYASEELVEEIRELVARGAPGAYWVSRHYVHKGEEILCSVAYPNRQMRVFHRDVVLGFRKPIHERLELKAGARIGALESVLLVPVETNVTALRQKTDRYITLEIARQMPITFGKAWRSVMSASKACVRYPWRFLTRIFCRGRRMPLSYEWESLRYEVRLAARVVYYAFSRGVS